MVDNNETDKPGFECVGQIPRQILSPPLTYLNIVLVTGYDCFGDDRKIYKFSFMKNLSGSLDISIANFLFRIKYRDIFRGPAA